MSCMNGKRMMALSRALALATTLVSGCVCTSDEPSIWITDMAPWGSRQGHVQGAVCGVAAAEARVVGYLYVPNTGGWWVKPTSADRRTSITPWGTWGIDTTTGGIDPTATAVAVFLIPRGYDPPALLGEPALPDELYANSLAQVMVQREAPPGSDGRVQPDGEDADDNGAEGHDGDPGAVARLSVNGGAGSGSYDVGEVVQLVAHIPLGHKFDHWEGDTATVADIYAASTTLTMESDSTIAASFFPWPVVAYRLEGLNFGPFVEPGQDPATGTVISQGQVQELIAAVGPYTKWIRTYGTGNGLNHVGRSAHKFELKVAIGAWISSNLEANEREIEAVIRLAQRGEADIIIVGTEVLLRGDIDAARLIAYITRVQTAVPGVLVSTADAHGVLVSQPGVVAACDVILANFYPYWEGVGIDRAVRTLHQQYRALQAAYPHKEIFVGETGWPSCGEPVGDAVPSPENATSYFMNFVSWARAEGVEYFYFEALDEPWKARLEGPQGACWGVWTSEVTLKNGFQPVFDGETVPDNWSGDEGCGPVDSILRFTYLPPMGSEDFLEGQVCRVPADEHAVALFIRVGEGWWTKPYWNAPLTPIADNGHWSCDIVTGGNDREANTIAAFLVPAGYEPPLMRGETPLPTGLYEDAIAHVIEQRTPPP
jgi:exo-beta-1,3-glucanase (GH17 family)